jgi:hypothetical protein
VLEFDDESDEQDVAEQLKPGTVAAVVRGTDWTAETIVSQLEVYRCDLGQTRAGAACSKVPG